MSGGRVLLPSPEHVALAAAALRRGELVGMPTETVYGLAAPAFDDRAVAQIFAAKDRPSFDPLIVHVAAAEATLDGLVARRLVDRSRLGENALRLVEALAASLWPGPLTLVLPRGDVPDLVTSGLDTIAVRTPRHPVAQALLEAVGAPLAAPSANRFGRISPTTARAVVEELGDRVALVLDGGPCEVGLESTIVRVGEDGRLALLRPGGVPREAIEAVSRAALDVEAPGARPLAPGQLASHYAPAMPVVLLPGAARESVAAAAATLRGRRHLALLLFEGPASPIADELADQTGAHVTSATLSERGDLAEAASRLFAALRALDGSGAEILLAELPPSEHGLGHAIADRLRRAAAPRNPSS